MSDANGSAGSDQPGADDATRRVPPPPPGAVPPPGGGDPTQAMDPATPPADPAGLDPTQAQEAARPAGSQHLRGVVREPEGDRTIAEARVVVSDTEGNTVGRATTVADGRFTVAALPPGRYRLTVTADGWFRS